MREVEVEELGGDEREVVGGQRLEGVQGAIHGLLVLDALHGCVNQRNDLADLRRKFPTPETHQTCAEKKVRKGGQLDEVVLGRKKKREAKEQNNAPFSTMHVPLALEASLSERPFRIISTKG